MGLVRKECRNCLNEFIQTGSHISRDSADPYCTECDEKLGAQIPFIPQDANPIEVLNSIPPTGNWWKKSWSLGWHICSWLDPYQIGLSSKDNPSQLFPDLPWLLNRKNLIQLWSPPNDFWRTVPAANRCQWLWRQPGLCWAPEAFHGWSPDPNGSIHWSIHKQI